MIVLNYNREIYQEGLGISFDYYWEGFFKIGSYGLFSKSTEGFD